jgi:beta-glucuronidase
VWFAICTIMMMKLLLLFIVCFVTCNGILYPKDSPSRLVKKLDGFWHFRIDNSPSRDEGFTNKWYSKPLQASGDTINMPVPSSYNDITQNSTIRDFIGWAWYDRNFWVPNSWFDKTRVVLRFEGANYYTYVVRMYIIIVLYLFCMQVGKWESSNVTRRRSSSI